MPCVQALFQSHHTPPLPRAVAAAANAAMEQVRADGAVGEDAVPVPNVDEEDEEPVGSGPA